MSQDPQEQLEMYLKTALQKLEKAYEKILMTHPYGQETENLKILIEMTKEQVPYENTRHATRETW